MLKLTTSTPSERLFHSKVILVYLYSLGQFTHRPFSRKIRLHCRRRLIDSTFFMFSHHTTVTLFVPSFIILYSSVQTSKQTNEGTNKLLIELLNKLLRMTRWCNKWFRFGIRFRLYQERQYLSVIFLYVTSKAIVCTETLKEGVFRSTNLNFDLSPTYPYSLLRLEINIQDLRSQDKEDKSTTINRYKTPLCSSKSTTTKRYKTPLCSTSLVH